jgi:cytochrome c553
MIRIFAVFTAVTTILYSGLSWGDEPTAEAKKAAAKVAIELCSSCHGPGGQSVSPQFPRLNGQQQLYLAAQLLALKSKTRADPEAHDFMWGMVRSLDDSTINGLAEYYARQPPMHGTTKGSTALVEKGSALFQNGVPSKNIRACAECHGENAEGQSISPRTIEGVSVFPRLAGQHADYLVRQISVIQNQLRDAPVMHGIVRQLSEDEKKALAVYLESLSGELTAEQKKAAAKVAIELCSSCHGPAGQSVAPQFPRLAGQQQLYLVAQLRALKSKTRADPEAHDFMWGVAGTLDDSLIRGLAEYYAKQPPMHGTTKGSAALIGEGEGLFKNGIPSKNIPACASCHGENAHGSSLFPRLAGQRAEYLARQLSVIQQNLRNSPIMHGIVVELSENEMKAVAAYLESL